MSFVLNKNDIVESKQLNLFVVITKPNGSVIGNASSATFTTEGRNKIYTITRQVLYGGNFLPVSMFYEKHKDAFISGTYKVEIFTKNKRIGKSSFSLK